MTAVADRQARDLVVDVAVVGGGLAGLATAAHLAGPRRRVVCIEPRPWPRPAVGESLEFSASRLLADLGIDVSCTDDTPHLFPKTSVAITSGDSTFSVWPPRWFARPPIWCSRVAFHTDRTELDHLLMHVAVDRGVEIVPERVTTIDHDQDGIKGLVTDQGTRIRSAWYVDATGHSCRLFGRTLGLDMERLGEPRVAYWARISTAPAGHATRLYFPEPREADLTWAWEIPLNPREVSIGTVMPATRLTALRERGLAPLEIFERQLALVPQLQRILDDHAHVEIQATTYAPYRHTRVLGPNWIVVGDASAMVDPLTSNGVTSALRHARQAAALICDALERHTISRYEAWAYEHTAPAIVATLERAIETFVYDPDVRRRLGLRWAVSLYAATGVITNSLYAKASPTTVPRSVGCATVLAASRLWTRLAGTTLPRFAPRRRAPVEPRQLHGEREKECCDARS